MGHAHDLFFLVNSSEHLHSEYMYSMYEYSWPRDDFLLLVDFCATDSYISSLCLTCPTVLM